MLVVLQLELKLPVIMNLAATDYLKLARKQIARKQWQEAIVSFQRAIKIQPDRWDTYFNLGAAFLQQQQYAKARASFERAIALEPDYAWSYYHLGEVYARQNLRDKSLVCFRQASTLNCSDYRLQFKLGKSFSNHGLTKEAMVCFCRTIELNPDFIPAYISLRYLEIEPEWQEHLVNFYRKIFLARPDLPEVLVNLAELLAEQNELAEAIAISRQAVDARTVREYPQLSKIDRQLEISAPDFIIIGAAKCGTTSLYKYLSYHPQILLPNKKELRFFDKNFQRGYEWYLAQFPRIGDRPELLTGEASPSYLFSPHVAQRIKDFAPKSKLIVMLRNPVERSISNYYQNQKTGCHQKTLPEAIEREIVNLSQKTAQQLSYGGGLLSQSLYYYKLKRWMKILPRHQFLILNSEKFFTAPATSLQQVFKFLELPDIQNDRYQKYNAGSYPHASDAIEKQLKNFFAIHNRRLEEFLQMNFDW